MKLNIPNLDANNVIEYCEYLDEIEFFKEDHLICNYGSMSTFNPFGMLVMGSKIREIISTYSNIKHSDEMYDKHTYAGTMGYFQSVDTGYGKKPGEALGSKNYIPLTKIELKDFEEDKAFLTEHIGFSIERHSERLANVLSRGNEELCNLVTFMIREMMRNVIEHSESETLWFSGQAWEQKGIVEIALVDEGIGIFESLKSNPYYSRLIDCSHKKAIMMSLLPGVTEAFKKKMDDDVWSNSGYGLFMVSELCKKLDGEFVLLSGESAIIIDKEKIRYKKSAFKGTAICMKINTSKAFSVRNIKSEIIKSGELKAKKMKNIALDSASAASKTISMSKLFYDE